VVSHCLGRVLLRVRVLRLGITAGVVDDELCCLYNLNHSNFSYLLSYMWHRVITPPIFAFPSHSPHGSPFTPVEPGYGVDLHEDDYLFLFLPADLRIDPAMRARPVSSVAFAYLGNAFNSTTRLNDGIFIFHRISVATSARLHQSEYVFCFFFFFLLFECKQWGPRPPKEHSSPSGAEDFCCLGFYYYWLFVSCSCFCSLHIPSWWTTLNGDKSINQSILFWEVKI
jgi:hypothetical protein